MNGLKDHCKCGHARETHFEKTEGCLAMCCECNGYRLYSDPDEPPTLRRPFKAAEPVEDFGSIFIDAYDDDDAPITWPMFPAAPKVKP